jgi:hypothetical protein
MTKPSYSKEMRAFAKENFRHLCTIAIPGMCFQGPCTNEELEVVSKALKEVVEMRQRRNVRDSNYDD